MSTLFLDADPAMAAIYHAIRRPSDGVVDLNLATHVEPSTLPAKLAGRTVVLNDHSFMPTDAMRQCPDVRHVIFLGTGARSYMDPDELATLGITVHTIKGYGDTAVAEHAMALLFAAARGLAVMDRGVRGGLWPRQEGMQLAGKTLGLIGAGGIGMELARIARGVGMDVIAWNRTPRSEPGVRFVPLEQVLADSHALSMHLLLTDETRGFLDASRIAAMRPDAILINTARGAVVDTDAMVAALRSGHLRHAALDVFDHEPLAPGHVLTTLENVTLSAHSGFCTPEASETLLRRALDIAAAIADKGPRP